MAATPGVSVAPMTQRPASDAELATLATRIEAWLERQRTENPVVTAVERDTESGERRWFVRVRGEQKDVFTIWFHLRQRTLHYETYVMPAPEENHAAFFEHLLRRNLKLYGAAFAIGDEDAVFLVGQIGNDRIDDDELDRLLGSLYAWVEQFFRPALRIGFASHFSR
jgi:Putative bacterial sensory transduction regulator